MMNFFTWRQLHIFIVVSGLAISCPGYAGQLEYCGTPGIQAVDSQSRARDDPLKAQPDSAQHGKMEDVDVVSESLADNLSLRGLTQSTIGSIVRFSQAKEFLDTSYVRVDTVFDPTKPHRTPSLELVLPDSQKVVVALLRADSTYLYGLISGTLSRGNYRLYIDSELYDKVQLMSGSVYYTLVIQGSQVSIRRSFFLK